MVKVISIFFLYSSIILPTGIFFGYQYKNTKCFFIFIVILHRKKILCVFVNNKKHVAGVDFYIASHFLFILCE